MNCFRIVLDRFGHHFLAQFASFRRRRRPDVVFSVIVNRSKKFQKDFQKHFEKDLQNRKQVSLPTVPLDEKLLKSLEEGMPPSSGMALGLDRLLLFLTGTQDIRQVLAFSWDEL